MRLFSAHDLSKSKAIKDKSQGKPTANQSATEKRPQTARAPFACSGQDGGRDARQRQLQNQPIGRSAYQSARPKGSHYVTNGTEIKADSEPPAIDDLQTKDKFVFAVAGWNF